MKEIVRDISVMLIASLALFCSTACSTNEEPNNKKEETVTVSLETTKSTFILANGADSSLILDKFIEFGMLENREATKSFSQANVLKADTSKVRKELIEKADVHYKASIEKVNKYDFNSLYNNPIMNCTVSLYLMVEATKYNVSVNVQKPLIYDKTWSTMVAACPISQFSPETAGENPTVVLSINGKTSTGNLYRRTTSVSDLFSITEKETKTRYIFQIKSSTQIQLVRYLENGSTLVKVADKNYFFNLN